MWEPEGPISEAVKMGRMGVRDSQGGNEKRWNGSHEVMRKRIKDDCTITQNLSKKNNAE